MVQDSWIDNPNNKLYFYDGTDLGLAVGSIYASPSDYPWFFQQKQYLTQHKQTEHLLI